MDPYVLQLEGRLNAIEFMLEQIIAQQCLAAPDPVQNASDARERLAVLASRSTAPGLAPEDAEALMNATAEALDHIMRKVLRRVREVSGE